MMKDYKVDPGLTVQGLPHNRVVGIIWPHDEPPKSSYNYEDEKEKEKLIDFKVDPPPGQLKWKKITTNQTGVLWVVINDAEVFRWDNGGLYFMKLVKP